MDDEIKQSGYALRCPECGGEVVVSHLEVEDELGRETVFLFSCENGDFSLGATAKTVDEMVDKIVTEIVVSRLGE